MKVSIESTPTRALPEFPPRTWWWHKELDGRRVLYPKMTLENLSSLPISNASPFRCVRCKVEGTANALAQTSCTDLEWYHGDIRQYRQTHDRVICNRCDHEWIVLTWHGFAKRDCPKCGGLDTNRLR